MGAERRGSEGGAPGGRAPEGGAPEGGVGLGLSRRALLRALPALAAAVGAPLVALRPRRASAFGERERVGVNLLDLGEGARERPRAVEQLMWEVSKRTSIDAREAPRWVRPGPELYDAPLVVWLGLGPCPALSEAERAALNQYLRAGGMLFIDDISPPGDDRFDLSVRDALRGIWPEAPLRRVSDDHTVYRSFFLLDRPYGRVQRAPYLEHIPFGELSAVLYGRNDTFGAFGREPTGAWRLPVTPGGEAQRERAFRFGVNLLMYATCLNYKRDQVHTLTILRRRQWAVEP